MSCCGGSRPRQTSDADVQAQCDGRPLRVTPDARVLAARKGIDLCTIRGTGRDGLVRKEDVEAAG